MLVINSFYTNYPMFNLSPERISDLLTASKNHDEIGLNHRTRAAVLIPLFQEDKLWKVIFTRRSQTVQDHKGQVSFPGGAFEWIDKDLESTALRETEEEIGIPKSQIKILGRMDSFPSISNYLITPVVGLIAFPFQIRMAEEEVDRVFTVRLDWLADPLNYKERDYKRSDGRIEKVIFYQEIDGELLWGITARILVRFITELSRE
jgi:8-oxo-dGTP pyrophosphatase MutT (NUDIX family)